MPLRQGQCPTGKGTPPGTPVFGPGQQPNTQPNLCLNKGAEIILT